MVEAFANAVFAAADTEVPPTPRRHRARGLFEIEETVAAKEKHCLRGGRCDGSCVPTPTEERIGDTGVYIHLDQYVAELERMKEEQRAERHFYKRLKRKVGVEGTKPKKSSASGMRMVYYCKIGGEFGIRA